MHKYILMMRYGFGEISGSSNRRSVIEMLLDGTHGFVTKLEPKREVCGNWLQDVP